jgi:4-hydroxybenzoate polyprenyltransferase
MTKIRSYLSLIKFSHTIFAMPFALIGFFEGLIYLQQHPEIHSFTQRDFVIKFILVIVCMVLARSAAMAFNRYLDHSIDSLNPRTAIREIPAGIIRPQQALWFTVLCSMLFVVTCYFINTLCFYLSFVALFVVLFYSYTKRFTSLCHLVLGVGLSLAPIGAFLALTGVFAWVPLLFSVSVITWVSGFDIIYALQDEQFDKSQNLHSIPAALGAKNALGVSRFLHLCSALTIMYAGYLSEAHTLYWCGALVFMGMLIYQQSLVKHDDLRKVNIAFMTANGIASVVFAVFVILDLFLRK